MIHIYDTNTHTHTRTHTQTSSRRPQRSTSSKTTMRRRTPRRQARQRPSSSGRGRMVWMTRMPTRSLFLSAYMVSTRSLSMPARSLSLCVYGAYKVSLYAYKVSLSLCVYGYKVSLNACKVSLSLCMVWMTRMPTRSLSICTYVRDQVYVRPGVSGGTLGTSWVVWMYLPYVLGCGKARYVRPTSGRPR